MTKRQPLFPHVPQSRQPKFPHVPKGKKPAPEPIWREKHGLAPKTLSVEEQRKMGIKTFGAGELPTGTQVRLKSGTEGWVKGTIVEYFDVISMGPLGAIYGGGSAPGYKVHILEGKHKGETIRVPTNYVERI